MTRVLCRAGGVVLTALLCATPALAATPAEIMQTYATSANSTPSAERGQAFFTTKQGKEYSCSSCHGPVPIGMGKNVETGREIKPMAPAANPERFKDPARVERFFTRQCNFVTGRECTAAEKADVIAFLISLKP